MYELEYALKLLLEELEAAGVIGPAEGTKPRKVLINKEEQQEKSDYFFKLSLKCDKINK